MDKLIKNFIKIRDFLSETIGKQLLFYLAEMWDPANSYVLIRETINLLRQDLINRFPTFPPEYLPQIKLKVVPEEYLIEKNVQFYFNQDSNLKFLACVDIDSSNYDLYYKKSFDLRTPYIFVAKYGHYKSSILKGSKTAAKEYLLGKQTPLSLAYYIAHQEGII